MNNTEIFLIKCLWKAGLNFDYKFQKETDKSYKVSNFDIYLKRSYLYRIVINNNGAVFLDGKQFGSSYSSIKELVDKMKKLSETLVDKMPSIFPFD